MKTHHLFILLLIIFISNLAFALYEYDNYSTNEVDIFIQEMKWGEEQRQASAFCNLIIQENGKAKLYAHYYKPPKRKDNGEVIEKDVTIKWFFYGWYEGENAYNKEIDRGTTERKLGNIELSKLIDITAYDFDYYMLECRNKFGANMKTEFNTESRFSDKKSPVNRIGERTGEILANRAVLHTYLAEQ